MNNKNIDEIKKTLIETISPKILPQKTIPLCVQIMRLLVKGRPVSPEQITSTGSFSINEVQSFKQSAKDGNGGVG